MTRLAGDRRGALMLEALIAFVPVALLFVALCQATDLYAHRLIVQRAVSAATRAAVVVLPDDGLRYGDPHNTALNQLSGARRDAIEAAARTVLSASPSFDAASMKLHIAGRFEPGTWVTATLDTDYACLFGHVRLVCGLDGRVRLTASAKLAYQGARYRYTSGG